MKGTFREHSGNIQGVFKEHKENVQGTFREHSLAPHDVMTSVSASLPMQSTG
jgi:hypothetical protein